MLDPRFYRDYNVLPTNLACRAATAFYLSWVKASRTRIVAAGWHSLPNSPCILATNSTQNQDFMALRYVAHRAGSPTVTVTKAKNYHNPLMAFGLKRFGVVPIASKGYFLLVDALAVLGRRPTDDEYRALRRHLDDAEPLPPGPLQTLHTARRTIVGHPFDPDRQSWRDCVRGIYRFSLDHTVRLARQAADAGYHIQMYPEGTVSRTLGTGRNGAVQLAWALQLPIVPIGMSGCPEAFWGDSPLVKGGTIGLRVGTAISLPSDLLPAGFLAFDPEHERQHKVALQGVTDQVMDQLNRLVDAPYRRDPAAVTKGKGTRAFL